MTTPNDSGVVDTTPTTGGSLPYAGSGYGGADQQDAPDVSQGFMHASGSSPRTVVLDGPATMKVRKPKADKSKGHKK